jgi:hypothetical protein
VVLSAIICVVVKRKSYPFQELSLSPMEKVINCSDGGWTVSINLCLTKETFWEIDVAMLR